MENDPFDREQKDHENITFMVKMTAEMTTGHIDHATARTIAAQWDAGATSDMHSFVTTGAIGEGLVDEIDANFNEATDPDDQQALAYLDAYVKAREEKGAVEGWSQLWLQAPPEYDKDIDDRCAACGEHIANPHGNGCPLDPENEVES